MMSKGTEIKINKFMKGVCSIWCEYFCCYSSVLLHITFGFGKKDLNMRLERRLSALICRFLHSHWLNRVGITDICVCSAPISREQYKSGDWLLSCFLASCFLVASLLQAQENKQKVESWFFVWNLNSQPVSLVSRLEDLPSFDITGWSCLNTFFAYMWHR